MREGESVSVGEYNAREAVVVWHELFTGVYQPLSEESVFAVPEQLVVHLAAKDPADMHAVALAWAPLVDMDFHDAFAHLAELSGLARTAISRAEALYCSVS